MFTLYFAVRDILQEISSPFLSRSPMPLSLTLIVPKYSATLFMQGMGPVMRGPLISGHSGHKGTNLKANDQVLQEHFFNGFCRYLTVKPQNRYSN